VRSRQLPPRGEPREVLGHVQGDDAPHISVCVCTYQRPTLLEHLLRTLRNQRTDGLFTYSIVVVDNDVAESARQIVIDAADGMEIGYWVEPNRNIAMARNKAVRSAVGDFVAFIDDDEFPVPDWLYHAYRTCVAYGADAVLGPVKPQFEAPPPAWVVKGRLFERPTYPTGTVLAWYNTRTGNVLLKRSLFETHLFRPEFRHSEDQDFFKRIMQAGHVAVWCDDATVFEVQRPERFRVAYFLKRALLRCNVSLRLQSNRLLMVAKSSLALMIYSLLLPVLAVVRRDLFIKFLIKECDHIGKLMAACRIDIQKYLA
jgi:succinoglycan biosynthesis protein ExoM